MSAATDLQFRGLFDDGLVLVAEASQCATQLRNVYRAAVLKENPKHAIMIIRELHGRLDQTVTQLAHFRAGLLALAHEIETQIPANEPTR